MRILLLCHAFNGLAQRLFIELRERGHVVAIELDVNDAVTAQAVERTRPEVIMAPYLKRAIAEPLWSRVPCLIVHPGVPGDRGPSALDWAIQEGEREWGVTVLQATGEMDAGPVWAHKAFAMRLATKSSLYRREVTEAAVVCVLRALERMARGETPERVEGLGTVARGRSRPAMRQANRAIDWARDSTLTVLRKIHAADGAPGVADEILGLPVHLFGAHRESAPPPGEPGTVMAMRDGAILRATCDGAVWITHLRAADTGPEPALKLPAAEVLGERLAGVREWPATIGSGTPGESWRELRYEERGPVGILHFEFHNGAMSAAQSRRLLMALKLVRLRPTRVLVLAGGPDFWCNGIHLNAIEASERPADAVGSSRVDLQACKLEYSIVSPK